MGLKVAVVGGGSTYTPELVEGFARRAAVLPIDELVLLDPDPERLEVVGGLAGRILRARGLARTADADRRPVGRPRRRRVHAHPAAGRRPGGAAGRRDAAAEVRPHRPGDDRAGRVREGPAHRAAGPRDRRGVRAARRARTSWILDFTNPVGIVTQALLDAGHRAIGLCNVAIGFQRWLAAHFDVRRIASRSTTSASTTCRGSARSASTASTACRSCSTPATSRDPGRRLPARVVRTLRAIPSYYLHYYYATDDVLRRQLDGRDAGERRDPHRARAPGPVQRPGAGPQARAPRAARRRLLQRGGGGPDRVAPHGRRRDPRGRRAERRRDPHLPDDAVVETPARIDRLRGRRSSRRRRWHPRCWASSST